MDQNSKASPKINKKSILIALVLVVALIVVFFATDLSDMVFSHKEYDAYKYAMECVKKELAYPETAKLPSYKNVAISKSSKTTEIILNKYKGGKSCKEAWDISGSGKCENALGMEMNMRFSVTVVLDDYGDYWCYECNVN